jgi:hypothetical protein
MTALDPQSVWELRWKAFAPDAEYHADWGIEQAWKAHATEWGYPMQSQETRYVYNGAEVGGRAFTLIGLIVWDVVHGAVIVGWPA